MQGPISELQEDIFNFLDAVSHQDNRELIEIGTDFLMAIHNYQKRLKLQEEKEFFEVCYLLEEIEKSIIANSEI